MLFDKFPVRSLQLANHMVMAPLTRSRATPHHTPNALMASTTPAPNKPCSTNAAT